MWVAHQECHYIITHFFFKKKKVIIHDEIWLDPTAEESKKARSSLILTCMPALGTITSMSQVGSMTTSESFSVCVI